MSSIANQITELITTGGKSASVITKALKQIGGGSMPKGIARIAEYYVKEGFDKGMRIGTVRGVVAGSAITFSLSLLIWFILEEIKEHRIHEKEGKALLKELEDAIADEAETSDNDKPYSDADGKDGQSEEFEIPIDSKED